MHLCSQDWATRGEMLKLTIESKSQWKDEVPHDWDLEGLPSLHLSSCYGGTFGLLAFSPMWHPPLHWQLLQQSPQNLDFHQKVWPITSWTFVLSLHFGST